MCFWLQFVLSLSLSVTLFNNVTISVILLPTRHCCPVQVPPQLIRVGVGDHGSELRWRVDLAASEVHWRGWFEGMSDAFIGLHVPRLLILAGITTLDKELTIGQMQGKFQLVVFDGVGHCLHEDAPARTAHAVVMFVQRFARKRKTLPSMS